MDDFVSQENRFSSVQRRDSERYGVLMGDAQKHIDRRCALYQKLVELSIEPVSLDS
jgi:hypothetical protein